MEILQSIWLLAKEYDEMLLRWKTTEFRQLQIDQLHDFAQSLHKKILKMSREYKVTAELIDDDPMRIVSGKTLGNSRFSSRSNRYFSSNNSLD